MNTSANGSAPTLIEEAPPFATENDWERGDPTQVEVTLVSQKQFLMFANEMRKTFRMLIFLLLVSTSVSIAHLVVSVVR